MSQTKAIVETIDVPVNEIKPSPYQPRMTFDLADIKGSIMRDGILVALTVRKKDDYYELVDGERRWRLAKELGYKTVPCNVIDIDDDTARRMVWKVNTLRKDYEPKEKAHFFKTMLEPPYGMSLRGIAREYDQSTRTVKAYLNVFKLPKDYQQMVWDRLIPLGVILELEPLFNGVEYSTPEDNPEIFIVLDRAKKEKGFDFMQAREAMKPYLAKLRKEQVDKAKEALAEVEPEVKAPETPEEFEEAARTFRREAKRRKTPKQIREEKQMKAKKTKDTIVKRLNEARDLILVDKYQKRIEDLEDTIKEDPNKALSELKTINGQFQADIKKSKEEEMRRKIEEEAKKRARELGEAERKQIEEEAKKKAQEAILSSPELLQEVAQRAREEGYEEFSEMQRRAREVAEGIAEPLGEALIRAEEESMVARTSEERRLLESYMFLGSIIKALEGKRIFCLEHSDKEPMLMWSCGTPITETHAKLRAKLRLGE